MTVIIQYVVHKITLMSAGSFGGEHVVRYTYSISTFRLRSVVVLSDFDDYL